ncbi:MAG: DUF3850 domain-containing protein [Candidatus Nealsonbacteria bacterium]|nr:DUF3850 domain-containing protein [Candidatus Nealsonbacteria bacterium]
MAVIKKKTWPKIFELIKKGKKRFDLRVADFKIKEGDTLILEEYDPKKKKYTGRIMKRKAKCVFKFKVNDFGQEKEIRKNGLYIIQF